jgi:hypothetical protein
MPCFLSCCWMFSIWSLKAELISFISTKSSCIGTVEYSHCSRIRDRSIGFGEGAGKLLGDS